MIQMDYKNLHKLLGGSLHYKSTDVSKETRSARTAPSAAMVMQGPWELALVSGKSVLMPNATLLSNLGGKLTLTETAKIECTLEVAMPADGSAALRRVRHGCLAGRVGRVRVCRAADGGG